MQYSGDVCLQSTCPSYVSGRSAKELDLLAQGAEDHALIIKAQRGDLAAFNELVLRYQDIVYRQAFWMLKEEEAAEDAAQDAFIKAYRKLDMFRLGRPFRSWLLKITTNHCLDLIRAAHRHPWLSLEPFNSDGDEMEPYWIKDPADTPEQAVERADVERRIAHAIQRLAPEYRTVVILVDLQELDYEEASKIMNVPLGTMKSRLSRARNQLRKALL